MVKIVGVDMGYKEMMIVVNWHNGVELILN